MSKYITKSEIEQMIEKIIAKQIRGMVGTQLDLPGVKKAGVSKKPVVVTATVRENKTAEKIMVSAALLALVNERRGVSSKGEIDFAPYAKGGAFRQRGFANIIRNHGGYITVSTTWMSLKQRIDKRFTYTYDEWRELWKTHSEFAKKWQAKPTE